MRCRVSHCDVRQVRSRELAQNIGARRHRKRMTRDFLSIGWKFPLQVNPDGKIARSQYEQRIMDLLGGCPA